MRPKHPLVGACHPRAHIWRYPASVTKGYQAEVIVCRTLPPSQRGNDTSCIIVEASWPCPLQRPHIPRYHREGCVHGKRRPPCGNGGPQGVAAGCGFDPGSQGRQMMMKNVSTRRTLYLAVVRTTLGYATQVWSPQSIDLIKRTERIQRRATKFILNLLYMCGETYKERLVLSNLIPTSYWHEYLDVLFFFKSINKHIFLSESTIPTRLKPSRPTRSVQSPNIASFKTSKCRATTFQRSFINMTVRIWNLLPSELRDCKLSFPHFNNLLLKHYY